MPPILDHTSDVVIAVRGANLRALFSRALEQMSGHLKPGYCQETAHFDCCKHIRLQAGDPTTLLVDFLSEALTFTYIEKAVFCYVYFQRLNEYQLTAWIFGRWYASLDNEIKAVTFHEARVGRTPGEGWEAALICDL